MYRIAVDVGGTFTDVVSVDDAGAYAFVKVPSTPADQSVGVMRGLQRLADRLDLPLADVLANTEQIMHGMTVATNALLERKGAKVGLLTTEGHRDILEMREGLKPERYDLRLARAEPLVPRRLRLGVRERLRADGRVEIPLDHTSLDKAIATLRRAKVDSVAVCYLHSYADASHELATRERLDAELDGVYVSLSAEVLPRIKEYQRLSTTVVNAYVGPLIHRYLVELEHRLSNSGFAGPLLVMLSHGGVAPVVEAVRIAAATVLSGPAGGLAGARRAAVLADAPNLIALDMGGTSTDISLVIDGAVTLSAERTIANEHIALPSLDIVTLGAGGGSIGRTDTGLLRVGPQSAGAVPGPACYGRGGTRATVTDASIVLGYLDPGNFLGGLGGPGELGGQGGVAGLDRGAAQAVLEELGSKLGLDAVRAAEGIHRVVNAHMAEGIRLATVRRGIDPRGSALLGFGGAAGLHATALARDLDLKRVVLPRMASVLSAWGMLATELRFEAIRSHIGETDRLHPGRVREIFAEMEAAGRARMGQWFAGEITSKRSADMRYGEQIFELDVDLEGIDFYAADLLPSMKDAFERRHRELYTYSLPDEDPVLINVKVATVGLIPPPPEARWVQDRPIQDRQVSGEPIQDRQVSPIGDRQVFLDGWENVPIYDFESLAAQQRVDGPAIVESDTTTVLLRRGDRATTTTHGWLDIAIET